MRNFFRCTDCVYSRLTASNPAGEIEIVGFVHQFKYNKGVVSVFGGQLGPEICELIVRWSSLPNDASIPSCEVMDIDHTVRACLEASLHEEIIVAKVRVIERSDHIICEILPRDSCTQVSRMEGRESSLRRHTQTENIHRVVLGEMRHLASSISKAQTRQWRLNRIEWAGSLNLVSYIFIVSFSDDIGMKTYSDQTAKLETRNVHALHKSQLGCQIGVYPTNIKLRLAQHRLNSPQDNKR